jgi:hypothetical protein
LLGLIDRVGFVAARQYPDPAHTPAAPRANHQPFRSASSAIRDAARG